MALAMDPSTPALMAHSRKRRRITPGNTLDDTVDSVVGHRTGSAPGGGPAIPETWGELYVLRTDTQGRAAVKEPPKFILPLLKDRYVLGRSSKCDIQINLPQCSREHLTIVKEHVVDPSQESGYRREVYLQKKKPSANWKTVVNGRPLESHLATFQIKEGDYFSVCCRPFKVHISEIGDEQKFYHKGFDHSSTTSSGRRGRPQNNSITNLSIEGRPATVAKNKSSRKRKRRLRSDVNESSIISDSLIHSPLEATPKDLRASFHTKRITGTASFDNGGSFQGSFLLADDSHMQRESLIADARTPSPMPMPSPEQQPSAMKSTQKSVGVPPSLTRVKSVRFGAFNEQAFINPAIGRPCSVTPATKILPPHQSKSAQKRVALGSMFKVGMAPSPKMPSTPAILGLGLMKATPTKNQEEQRDELPNLRWGRENPEIYRIIVEVMKMPKARKPHTLLPQLDQIRAKIWELIVLVKDKCSTKEPDEQEGIRKQTGLGLMKLFQGMDFAHPVLESVRALLAKALLPKAKKFRGKESSKHIKTLWDAIKHLQRHPGDVTTLRLEAVSCIVDTLLLFEGPDMKRAREECLAMFQKLGEATGTSAKNVPELAGKRLRQGLKRLVNLEHHKAEEIIVQLSHKLNVDNRARLPEVAEESIRFGLKELLRNPDSLGCLSAEHRNMAISSLSELLTIGTSSLTALLTSTSKELNSYGGHLDTNNAVLVGISQIMARPYNVGNHEADQENSMFRPSASKLDFSNMEHHASICEGANESTVIGMSAVTPSVPVRKFQRGDRTPYNSAKNRRLKVQLFKDDDASGSDNNAHPQNDPDTTAPLN